MAAKRYIADGRIYFVRVTVVLRNGKVLTAIDDTTVGDVDANWLVYYSRVQSKLGGQMESCQVVQLSRHDPEVKRYIKGEQIHVPSRADDEQPQAFGELGLTDAERRMIGKLPRKKKAQPGKYRG